MLPTMLDERSFDDGDRAAAALARDLAQALRDGIAARGMASAALPGGRTPGLVLPHLVGPDRPWPDLPWTAVHLTLTDERRVPVDHPDSNEGMLRRFLTGPAAQVQLHGLSAEAAACGARIDRLRPFDAVFLGFGEDGHIASLFPGSPALDAAGTCVAAPAAGIGHARLSLTLPALLDARRLLLLVVGAAKRRIYTAARAGAGLPLSRILDQDRVPVTVYLAP